MTDLSQDAARDSSPDAHRSRRPRVETRQTSTDGTTKFLLKLADGRHIEAVYIPDTPAQTFCISTQVGCAMGCTFCLTGKMGLVRHLTAGEIAGQVRVLAHATGLAGTRLQHRPHGHGRAAPQLRRHDEGAADASPTSRDSPCIRGASRCRPSVSCPAIEKLADRAADAEPRDLASRDDRTSSAASSCRSIASTRSQELIDACRRFPLAKRRRITFEYVLLDRRERHARRRAPTRDAARRHQGEGQSAAAERSAGDSVPAAVGRARQRVREDPGRSRHLVSVRKSRGRDIRAACGQLIVEGEKASAGQRLAREI